MKEFFNRLGIRVIAEALIVWAFCAVLAMMVLDGGWVLGYYFIASLFFWSGSFVYFLSRRSYWPGDLWTFRLGPFILLILGFVGETAIDIFRR
jgi:hypothetical protein